MKILLVCDPPVGAKDQNVGGTHAVVGHLMDELQNLGHQPALITGAVFFHPLPQGMSQYEYVESLLDEQEFDAIHIVTQGRLGLMARRYCVSRGLRFSNAYHTQIPEYMEVRWGVPASVGHMYMRWFMNGAETTIVPTPAMAARLTEIGVTNAVSCLHGVDTHRFQPVDDKSFLNLPRPVWLYVGRVTEEKNTGAFCSMRVPGTKVVVGDGDLRASLEARYPDVVFAGVKKGEELPKYYAAADCFVFPSRTDTFGLVLLEALAAGVPVAAYPVTGPIDVVTDPRVGCLDEDLEKAAMAAVQLSPRDCREFALKHSWAESTKRWLSYQVPCRLDESQPKRGAAPLWFESIPNAMTLLEDLIGNVERMLFASEPSGPYAKVAAK